MSHPDLQQLLESHQVEIERIVAARGKGLLRHESVSDLLQGVQLRALEVEERFEYQGEREFLAWIGRVARQHLADRGAYWRALRRRAGKVLRITASASPSDEKTPGVAPSAHVSGPNTVAARREQVAVAMKALAVLFPRDRDLVQWTTEEVELPEMADRLCISYEAAKRARQRALERFRKTFELLVRAGSRE